MGAEADVPLFDHALIVIQRSQLNIGGKSGIPPDVFAKVFGIGTLASDPEQRVTASMPPGATAPAVRVLYKRAVTKLDDGSEAIQVVIDADDADKIGTILQRERTRAGVPVLTEADMKSEISRVLGSPRGRIEKPEIAYKVPIDLVHYQRGILKIAYELAWYWLGEPYLDDPAAARMRAALLRPQPVSVNPASHGVRGTITLAVHVDPFPLWNIRPNMHIALAMRAGNAISIGVRIFNTLCGVLAVCDSADRYPAFAATEREGYFLEIDPQTGAKRETTMAEEVARLCAR